MARVGVEEQLRLFFVASGGIANKNAPTAAEVNAGVDLTAYLVRDGLDTPLKGNTRDASDVSSRYNSTSRGTYGGDPITATFYRDSVRADDDAWTTLTPTTDGFLVVARMVGAAAAAGEYVEVWPVEVISREPVKIAQDENQKVMVTMAVPSAPVVDVALA